MIVDTSALVRVFVRELGYEPYDEAISKGNRLVIPAVCFVEFGLLRKLGTARMSWLESLGRRDGVTEVGFDPEQRHLAVLAARTYGKGSGHPAQLNFGDCLVYAIAKYRDLPLLFVGDDFSHTDIVPALKERT